VKGQSGPASAPAAKRYVMRKKEELMNSQSAVASRSPAYCCFRFRESVKVDKTIIRATRYDETEWHLAQGCHIYFCPFCGSRVKGKGFGTYKQAALTVEEVRALKTRTASRAATAIGPNQGKKTKHA